VGGNQGFLQASIQPGLEALIDVHLKMCDGVQSFLVSLLACNASLVMAGEQRET
jgi:hypothetical protein